MLGLDNFRLLLDEPLYIDAFVTSLRLAGLATVADAADRLSDRLRHGPRARAPAGLLVMLAILPFWTSFLIRVYAWIGILKPEGLLNAGAAGASGSSPSRCRS